MRCEWCQSLDYEVRPGNHIEDVYICRNPNCRHEWISVTTDKGRLKDYGERSKRLFEELTQKFRSSGSEEYSDS